MRAQARGRSSLPLCWLCESSMGVARWIGGDDEVEWRLSLELDG